MERQYPHFFVCKEFTANLIVFLHWKNGQSIIKLQCNPLSKRLAIVWMQKNNKFAMKLVQTKMGVLLHYLGLDKH